MAGIPGAARTPYNRERRRALNPYDEQDGQPVPAAATNPEDADVAARTDDAPAPAVPEPTPSGLPYTWRPAEFRPAVFIPAEPRQHQTMPAEVGTGLGAAELAPASPLDVRREPVRPLSHTLSRIGEELVAWFKTLVSAAVYATLIVTFGFQVARVEGQSMIPTLEDQDRLIVNKLAYRMGAPQVGDVVMLYYPEDPDKSFVKRVVAEEGDTIRSADGRVYRNEVPLDDAFIPEEYRSHDSWGPYTVQRGYYFVMGDHRNNSSDSRSWGQVPKKYIIGKVQLRWWPLSHARVF